MGIHITYSNGPEYDIFFLNLENIFWLIGYDFWGFPSISFSYKCLKQTFSTKPFTYNVIKTKANRFWPNQFFDLTSEVVYII